MRDNINTQIINTWVNEVDININTVSNILDSNTSIYDKRSMEVLFNNTFHLIFLLNEAAIINKLSNQKINLIKTTILRSLSYLLEVITQLVNSNVINNWASSITTVQTYSADWDIDSFIINFLNTLRTSIISFSSLNVFGTLSASNIYTLPGLVGSSNWNSLTKTVTQYYPLWSNIDFFKINFENFVSTYSTVSSLSSVFSQPPVYDESTVFVLTSFWDSVFNTISSLSGTEFGRTATSNLGEIHSLSGKFNEAYALVNQQQNIWSVPVAPNVTVATQNSSIWNSAYNTTKSMSAIWGIPTPPNYSFLVPLSTNWYSVFTTVRSLSEAFWQNITIPNIAQYLAKWNAAFTLTSQQSGSRWSNTASFKNKFINGNFDIWQRGTDLTRSVTSYAYDKSAFLADRCITATAIVNNGAVGTYNVSRRLLDDQDINFFSANYYCRLTNNITSIGIPSLHESNTDSFGLLIVSNLENTHEVLGKQLTLSFWARASSNTKIFPEFQIFARQGVNPFWTKALFKIFDITTTWKKYVWTFNVPTYSNVIANCYNPGLVNLTTPQYTPLAPDSIPALNDWLYQVDIKTFWSNGTRIIAGGLMSFEDNKSVCDSFIKQGHYDVAQIQLEEGPIDSGFEHRPIHLELPLCQRYYYKTYDYNTVPGTVTDLGASSVQEFVVLENGGLHGSVTHFPVTMYRTPGVNDVVFYNPRQLNDIGFVCVGPGNTVFPAVTGRVINFSSSVYGIKSVGISHNSSISTSYNSYQHVLSSYASLTPTSVNYKPEVLYHATVDTEVL